jgi:hypothetical protein
MNHAISFNQACAQTATVPGVHFIPQLAAVQPVAQMQSVVQIQPAPAVVQVQSQPTVQIQPAPAVVQPQLLTMQAVAALTDQQANLHAMALQNAFASTMSLVTGGHAPVAQAQQPITEATKVEWHKYENDESPMETPVKVASENPTSSQEDKAAGSILLGFLSTLRQSYLQAVHEKQEDETCYPHLTLTNGVVVTRAPTVTDSQPSSGSEGIDDDHWSSSGSSRKNRKDPSSSQESDKEEVRVREELKGPPRKRMKRKMTLSDKGITEY